MDGKVIIGTEIDTKSFEAQIDELEDKLDTLQKEYKLALKDADFPEEQIIKYRREIEQTTNKIVNLRKKQNELNQKNIFGNMSNSLGKVISKVTKWGLAVFGVRSAYMFVRQAMSTLSEYDDGLSTKLEYIRWLIATALKPVIEWIVNAVFKVLGIIGGIIKLITGVNIFANSSAKSFEKMKKNANATSKATKEIKKDLYGWDEATRIEESGGLAGIGGAGSKFVMPDIPDFSKTMDEWANKVKTWFLGGDTLADGFKNTMKIWESDLSTFDKAIFTPYVKNPVKNFFYPIDKYVVPPIKKAISEVKELLKPITNFFDEYFVSPIKGMFSNLRQVLTPIINGIIDDVNHLLEPLGLKIPRIENKIKISAKSSEKSIEGALIGTDKKTQETGKNIEENITDNIKDIIYRADELGSKEFNIDIKAPTLNPIEQTINKLKEGLKTLTGKTWKMNASLAISGATKGAVSGATQINTVNVKMAKGGILNNPGRGVPVGGALAGEKGREFYMPLQDEQMLNMVGEAIGRYVTINLTNINKMNGRVLNRETKRISADNDFATNGGI